MRKLSLIGILLLLPSSCIGERPLQAPRGGVIVDMCGACDPPFVCYYDPNRESLVSRGESTPHDVFTCTSAALPEWERIGCMSFPKEWTPPPPLTCPRSHQRYWNRSGKQFMCCVNKSKGSVECQGTEEPRDLGDYPRNVYDGHFLE